jgi:hypothetical protein
MTKTKVAMRLEPMTAVALRKASVCLRITPGQIVDVVMEKHLNAFVKSASKGLQKKPASKPKRV